MNDKVIYNVELYNSLDPYWYVWRNKEGGVNDYEYLLSDSSWGTSCSDGKFKSKEVAEKALKEYLYNTKEEVEDQEVTLSNVTAKKLADTILALVGSDISGKLRLNFDANDISGKCKKVNITILPETVSIIEVDDNDENLQN